MEHKKGPRSGWHPKFRSIRQRAIEAGVSSFYYDAVYGFTSRYVHGSGDWMAQFFSSTDEKSRISYKGDQGESALATMMACTIMIALLQILNDCLSLDLGDALGSLLSQQAEIERTEYKAVLSKHGIAEQME
jgi:hypothetical protein